MKIDIISDTICPWCLVGKRRLEAALAQRPDLDVEIYWHPFQLNPEMPDGGIGRPDYLQEKFGEPNYPSGMLDNLISAGKSVDFEFKFDTMSRVPNTVSSHRVIRWATEAGLQDELVEDLFHRYFIENEDIGDISVLSEAAGRAGMDADSIAERLQSDEDAEVVRTEDKYAREMGIRAVPTFIFDGKMALQGAQPPEAFLQLFKKLEESSAEPVAAVEEAGAAD
jgi:predicted DsbA family dithiol-disulfide isomerase